MVDARGLTPSGCPPTPSPSPPAGGETRGGRGNPSFNAWRSDRRWWPRVGEPIVRLAAVGAALLALTAAGPTLHLAYGGWALMLIFAAGGIGILLAWRIAEGADQRSALLVILAGAVAMRLALLLVEPYLSTDIYRYIWDGRVQAAGINPYRYLPAAPELAHLRDAAIFPRINRADSAVTIYPPVAQAIFLMITRLGESVVAMKLGLLAFEAATVAALIAILRRLGQPATRVVAYAWHPLAIWEIAGSGHIDGAMCALMTGGLLLFLLGRTLLAGVAVTLGALVKPTALLALPVLWRPWDWRLPLIVLVTLVLAYVPYLSVGSGVLGYLGGYVQEEGLASGRGFNVLWLLEGVIGPVPDAVRIYVAVAMAIMIGLAVAVTFRRDRSPEAAVAGLGWLLAAFLTLASPHYPWYLLALVPLLSVHASATAGVLTLASPLLYDSAVGTGWLAYDVRIAAFTLATVVALAFDARGLRRGIVGRPLNRTVGETP
jgi:alpha-1,6-mannosyltransferase